MPQRCRQCKLALPTNNEGRPVCPRCKGELEDVSNPFAPVRDKPEIKEEVTKPNGV